LGTFDPRPWVREYTTHDVETPRLLRVFARAAIHEPLRKLGLAKKVPLRGRHKTTPPETPLGLQPGDLVVHAEHGIGRYDGLEAVTADDAPHDCLRLIYDGNEKLYLPVENIEVLSRYGSETQGVALDKMGGVGWQTRKARMKSRIRDMAAGLIRVAAERKVREAMKGIKEGGQAVAAAALASLGDFAPPTLLAQAARLQAVTRFFNLVITNVPGPQHTLDSGGRRLLDIFPVVRPMVEVNPSERTMK